MIEEDGCQELSARVGECFLRGMMSLRDDFEVVGDVRGKGLMLGMELVKSKVGSYTCAIQLAMELWLIFLV